ncbi:MAG: hypothetical protein JW726_14910 [Anaerolineales bacterium]|nr:hypothetical protein [Anaerolineales bacterium]
MSEQKGTAQKSSSGCLKTVALIVAVLLVVALPISLFAFDLGRAIFNVELVKRIITDEVVNSDLIPVALEWYSDRRAEERVATGEAMTGISEPDVVLLMSYLDRDDWREIKSEVLPAEILTEWTSVTVDGVYKWIDTNDRVPQITWKMQTFKERVNGQHGSNCIVITFKNLEPCTQEEIEDFQSRLAAAPSGTEVLYNLCNFPDPWHEDQFNDYLASLQDVVNNIPNEFALTEELAQVEDTAGVGPEALKQTLRSIRFWAGIAWLVPLALALILAALVVRSLEGLGRWIGFPLMVGGVLTLLPALTYRWLITNILAAGPLSETPELVMQEATRSILRLAAEVFRPLMWQALVLILVGLALAVFALLRRRSAKEAPLAASEEQE